ncbi:MAG: hypothetical protein HQL91_02550 [Magnetococcales bacterium]|nr:hypothetical protein [Magnetococcales bacterium]
MPEPMSKEQATGAVLSGIINAFDKYTKWNGLHLLNKAPEYLVTCNIAEALFEAGKAKKFIALEGNVRSIMKDGLAVGPGKPKDDLRIDGRSDIALYNSDGNPEIIVEVKSPLFSLNKNAINDIKRIRSVLAKNHENNTLRFGLFAFYTSEENSTRNKAEDILTKRLEGMAENARKCCDCTITLEQRKIDVGKDKEFACFAACFVIEI